MGQQITKEHGSSGSGSHLHNHHHHANPNHHSSSSVHHSSAFPAHYPSATSNASSSLVPPSPPPLPPHLLDSVSVDNGGLIPTGVYSGPQDYNQHIVRQAIVDRRLAPFYVGSDDQDEYTHETFNGECPICFLYYPSPLNFSRCCHQPICTECFVQMKRADPTATNPPSSQPRSCPFCVEPDFGITYTPSSTLLQIVSDPHQPEPNDATQAANFAEMAIATGGAGNAIRGQGKKKVLAVDDPSVITVDHVRPDWRYKLAQAQAAVTRRANRRVIMRQVGDRLIPIGISSSRFGADLATAAENGSIHLNGPGGSIILQDDQIFQQLITPSSSSNRRSRASRSEGPNNEVSRLMRMTAGEEMEEIMLLEAMRLSLLEHEEQQRRETEAKAETEPQQSAGQSADPNPSANQAGPSLPIASPSVSASSPSANDETSPSIVAPGLIPTMPQRTNTSTSSLIITPTAVAELEGGSSSEPLASFAPENSGAQDSIMASPHRQIRTNLPAPEPVPVPQPIASMGSSLETPTDKTYEMSKQGVEYSTTNLTLSEADFPDQASPSVDSEQ